MNSQGPTQKSHTTAGPDAARQALAEWQQSKRKNFFSTDTDLQAILSHHLGADGLATESPGLAAFGEESATILDDLIRENNRDENLPTLRRFDSIGRRIDEVIFHPSYFEIGRLAYRTGAMSRYARPGNERVQLAYAYLLAQHGEGGHLCPFACTAGLIKILQARADESLKERLLPGLLHHDRTAPEHYHGAQFLTEIQGGSDVGANAMRARRDGDTWRLHGEKWFCSVIDADLYLVTARPEGAPSGTPGLGAFVVPRRLPDGTPNGVHIRRLKYKLGTRSMASGEADFVDALAWAVGDPNSGFKSVVEIVLNTSRVYNAVAACGMMRRAEIEATTYAAHREAFGQKIESFPLVRRTLTKISTERRRAVAGTFGLIALSDRIALGQADDQTRNVFRLVVNMNKYWTAIRCTDTIRDAIEILGGNGAIEDFSVLPRLLRDSIVIEAWEGTHNVLCAQILRDLQKFKLHDAFFAFLAERARSPQSQSLITDYRREVAVLLSLPADEAALRIRDVVDQLMPLWQRVCVEQSLDHTVNPAHT